jgi:uncharacterized membrane protein
MALRDPNATLTRAILRGLMAAVFGVAGVMHFVITRDYMTIMPDWVPAPRAMVLFTGFCEVAGSSGLLIPQVRKLTGVMLAIFLVCVFPANVTMAVNHIPVRGHVLGWGYHVVRFALQPVLIWWALFCAEVIHWPMGKRDGIL